MNKSARYYLENYAYSSNDEPSTLDELVSKAQALQKKADYSISLDTAIKAVAINDVSNKITALQRVSTTLFKQLY